MNPQQSELLEKAARAVRSAELLAADGDFEAATSRAYYAMFCAVEALLLLESLTFSSHSAVISAFGRVFAKTGRVPAEFHSFLRDAAEARIVSDHEVGPKITSEKAVRHISRAKRFIDLARDLVAES